MNFLNCSRAIGVAVFLVALLWGLPQGAQAEGEAKAEVALSPAAAAFKAVLRQQSYWAFSHELRGQRFSGSLVLNESNPARLNEVLVPANEEYVGTLYEHDSGVREWEFVATFGDENFFNLKLSLLRQFDRETAQFEQLDRWELDESERDSVEGGASQQKKRRASAGNENTQPKDVDSAVKASSSSKKRERILFPHELRRLRIDSVSTLGSDERNKIFKGFEVIPADGGREKLRPITVTFVTSGAKITKDGAESEDAVLMWTWEDTKKEFLYMTPAGTIDRGFFGQYSTMILFLVGFVCFRFYTGFKQGQAKISKEVEARRANRAKR
jgi:hypothetical protein